MNLFEQQRLIILESLLRAPKVDVGEWHAMDVSGRPELVTRETSAYMTLFIPDEPPIETHAYYGLESEWAEEQFLERVQGTPFNPPPSYSNWPHQSEMGRHLDEQGQFSHTYPERYWPKSAGPSRVPGRHSRKPIWGVRYAYGDLSDLLSLLSRSPHTRQAYLPVWFPEDTGAVHGGRVPCSLGYHFLFREGRLSVSYFIRSCDFVRHFRDDVYMTARLAQWVLEELKDREMDEIADVTKWVWHQARPGFLQFVCPALHIMEGDVPKLTKEFQDATRAINPTPVSYDGKLGSVPDLP